MKLLIAGVGVLASLVLTGCENSGASYEIGGDRNHSISLLREQNIVWFGKVQQRFVVSRFPVCQRRFTVDPGTTNMRRMDLYEIGPRLFVAHQGETWYALTTEDCRVQKLQEPPPAIPPERLAGTFEKKEGALVFKPAQEQDTRQ